MDTVWIRIALSFFVAGAWIAGATLLGERLGSKKAGLIANLPSNILVSLLFVSLTRGVEYTKAATSGVPVGMGVDTVFLAVFILALPKGTVVALVSSLAAWAIAAGTVVFLLPQPSYLLALGIYAAITVVSYFVVDRFVPSAHAEKRQVPFSWGIVGIRALFAGTVVAGAVTAAQFAPPYMTGILATFPAALTSTLVILAISQGVAFTQAAGKVLIISSANIILYATLAGVIFPLVGPWAGTLLAFAASFGFVFLLGGLTKRLK